MVSEKQVVRIDNNNGSEVVVSLEEAETVIVGHFGDHGVMMDLLLNGRPIRCTFATYELREVDE